MKDVTDEGTKRFGPQLELCRKSSLNPFTNKFYAYSPGWVPDPGNYRKSLWEPVGFPNGPSTWDDGLSGFSFCCRGRRRVVADLSGVDLPSDDGQVHQVGLSQLPRGHGFRRDRRSGFERRSGTDRRTAADRRTR